MKHTILVFVILFCICSFNNVWSEDAGNKTAVVYYSRDGHTKKVAEALARRFNADIFRIIDKKQRKGIIATSIAGKDAIAKNLTEIEPISIDLDKYAIVLIGTPGWFSNMTPAVRTFIKDYDLTGKNVGVFGTSHLSGIKNAVGQIAALVSGSAYNDIPKLPLVHADLEDSKLKSEIDSFYDDVMNNLGKISTPAVQNSSL